MIKHYQVSFIIYYYGNDISYDYDDNLLEESISVRYNNFIKIIECFI